MLRFQRIQFSPLHNINKNKMRKKALFFCCCQFKVTHFALHSISKDKMREDSLLLSGDVMSFY
ncbi:hypothetical protein V6Z11_D03G160900 [Gossypium hirsutum]